MKSVFKLGCGGLLFLVAIIIVVAVVTADKSSRSSSTVVDRQTNSEFTLAQYDQLQPGMTQEQVAGILKTNGIEQSSTSVSMGAAGSTSSTVRTYKGDGFMAGTITVVYSDGKLMSKSQFGLK